MEIHFLGQKSIVVTADLGRAETLFKGCDLEIYLFPLAASALNLSIKTASQLS